MLPALLYLGALTVLQQESTLPPGAKLPPYSFLLSIGEQRGRSHCYVCESQEKPVIVLFAATGAASGKTYSPSAKTTQLAQFLDEALAKRENLAAWLTLLHANQEEVDGPIVKWAAATGLRNLPVGVFEDPLGPPAYRLAPTAAMTAIVANGGKIEKVLVYREGEAISDFQKAVNAELDRIAPIKPKANVTAAPPAEKETPKPEAPKKP